MVKLLITLGNADVNAMDLESRTPLHSCAWQGNHEVMQLLLYYGAIPDHACKQGATALGISAQEGHEKCVTYLLKYGANPYKSDHCGRTPIKLAAKSNRNNVLRILENFTKNDLDGGKMAAHQNLNFKSPDELPPSSSIHNPSPSGPFPNPNLLMPNNSNSSNTNSNNNNNVPSLNATSSTQNSNFYENTMQSDNSSLQKRKSVISSQSTGSSNEQVPMSFTQQLQKHSRHHNSKSHHIVQQQHQPHHQVSSGGSSGTNSKYGGKKHSQILPNVEEYQTNIASNIRMSHPNDADLFDLGCMSPLYATPPHSPSSDVSSPGQNQPPSSLALLGKQFEEMNISLSNNSTIMHPPDNHFARDTHMRIILGNNQKEQQQGGKSSKRSGIATNPAMRLIRNRIDSAAQLIRRTNNILSSGGSSQGSSSIGVKSGTFQWRKESQM